MEIKKKLEFFQSLLKEKKIKSIPLKVSAPFTVPMKPAASVMKEKLIKLTFLNLKVDIVSNVTSNVESDPEKIKKLLIEQIFQQRWRESIENIS